jgi:hypothetical protein
MVLFRDAVAMVIFRSELRARIYKSAIGIATCGTSHISKLLRASSGPISADDGSPDRGRTSR